MGGALFYGFTLGDFWKDGGELMNNPWGVVSLFDVYVVLFFHRLDLVPGMLPRSKVFLGIGNPVGWKSGSRNLCHFCPA